MSYHVRFRGGGRQRRHIEEEPAPAPPVPPRADSLAGFAARHGLDAEGMLRLAAQAGTRRLARTEADRQAAAAASDQLYDACYGAGAAAADRRRTEARPV
jgi:hypothetical protein